MKKKVLAAAVSTAMLSTMMIVGSASAINRVETKVTSEPIQSRTTCDKAGGFSLSFDETTVLNDGDKITIDLDYITPSNFAALCRDIDFMLSPNATAHTGDGTLTGDGDFVGYTSDTLTTGPVQGIFTASAPGVVFHVSGSAATQRIEVDVLGGDIDGDTDYLSVTAGGDLTIKFLDQYAGAGIYTPVADEDDTTSDVYSQAGVLEDNTLCIDVSEWDSSTVKANFDSQEDKYTFTPVDPQIAHIIAAAQYQTVDSKGQMVGTVAIGENADQEAATCTAFDNDSDTGYCYDGEDSTNMDNSLIINRTDGAFDADDYSLTLTILVNGEEGANGVYFADSVPTVGGADDLEAATEVEAGTPVGAATYYNSAGEELNTDDLGVEDCVVELEGKAVSLTTAGASFGLSASNDFLKINLPSLVYAADEVDAGDEVTVQVTVTRAPCGELITADHMVATLTDECAAAATADYALFPYFTEADGTDFWDGMAVVNTSDSDGTATITMREADGDVAQAVVEIAAYGMYVNTLSAMVADGDFTLIETVEGTLGNARSQIQVDAENMTVDGFGMIGNPDTGESMGYLPRQN